jgi:hypothetical protein
MLVAILSQRKRRASGMATPTGNNFSQLIKVPAPIRDGDSDGAGIGACIGPKGETICQLYRGMPIALMSS